MIKRSPGITAYKVRKKFEGSKSVEWSGSTGAVYPAIRRLEAERYVRSTSADDARGTLTYELTAKGTRALDAWAVDAERAAGPGMDPFRSRAALWPTLSHHQRGELGASLEAAVRKRRAEIEAEMAEADALFYQQLSLELALQDARLAWLKANF